jgi:hypothetical protein
MSDTVDQLQRQVTELQQALLDEQDLHRRTKSQHERWRDSAIETLHEAADAHELCSDFDDTMEQIGFPRRMRTYSVEVRISYSETVEVEAQNDDDAREQAIEQVDENVSHLDNVETEVAEVEEQ